MALLGQGGQAVAALALTLAVARAVPPSVRGEFVLLALTPQIGAYFLTLGLPSALLHMAAKNPRERPSLAGAALIASIAAGFVMSFACFFFVGLSSNAATTLALLVAGNVGQSYLILAAWLGFGLGRYLLSGVMRAAPMLVAAVAVVALAIDGNPGLAEIYAVWALAHAACAIGVAAMVTRRLGFGLPTTRRLRQWISFGALFSGNQIAVLLAYRVDQWILAGLASTAAVGIYSAAVSLTEGIALLATAVAVVTFVEASRDQDDVAVMRQIGVAMAVSIVPAGLLAAFAPMIVNGLFGSDYASAGSAVRILLLGTPGLVAARIALNWLAGQQRPGLASVCSIATLVATVALDLILIPRFGISGAAWASVIGYNAGGIAALAAIRMAAGDATRSRVWDWGRIAVVAAAIGLCVASVGLAVAVVWQPVVALGCIGLLAAVAIARLGLVAGLMIPVAVVMTSGLLTTRGVPDGLLDVVVILALLVGLTGAMTRVDQLQASAPDYLLGAFIGLALLWGLFTAVDDPARALAGTQAWCLWAALYLIARVLIADPRTRGRAAVAGGIILAAVFLYGIKQFLLGYTPAELAAASSEKFTAFITADSLRLSATLKTNQDFAAVLLLTVPLLVGCVITRGLDRRYRALLGALLLLAAPLSLLSMFRTAVVACIVGVIALVCVTRIDRGRRALGLLLILVLTAVAFQAALTATGSSQGTTVVDRLQTLSNPGKERSSQQRLQEVWPQITRDVLAQPFGHGVGLTNGPGTATLPIDDVVTTDNGYLSLAYELGIPGLFLYLSWLFAVARAAARGVRVSDSAMGQGFCVGTIGAMAALATAMIGASWVQLGGLQVLLFPIAGAAVSIAHPVLESVRERVPVIRRGTHAVPA